MLPGLATALKQYLLGEGLSVTPRSAGLWDVMV